MGMKVSVVVPIHNPGPHLDTCLGSLLAQSLDPGEYEVLFVDAGSTDGSLRRLENFAERHPQVRVIHGPSGRDGTRAAPGQLRNIGIERASGEYLYFLTASDQLAPLALERMYALATRTSADIVVGKIVGHGGRVVPVSPFRESRDAVDPAETPELFSLATAHKLFRVGFLLQDRLRFAETGGAAGPLGGSHAFGLTDPGLVEQRFVTQAYFLAKTISVLADTVCCHWGSATSFEPRATMLRRSGWAAHLQAFRALLDLVDQHTDPGDVREAIYARLYADHLLNLLEPRSLFRIPLGVGGHGVLRGARQLLTERIPPPVERRLPPSARVRSRLLRAGAYADVVRLTTAERGLTLLPTLESVVWEGNTLLIRVCGQLAYASGQPVRLRPADGRLLWVPPVPLKLKAPTDAYDVSKLIDDSRLEVYVRNRADSGDYLLPTQSTLVREQGERPRRVVLRGTARLEPRTARLGQPLDTGTWDLFVRIESCGWVGWNRLARPYVNQAAHAGADVPAPARSIGSGSDSLVVEPFWTARTGLSLHVQ
jgi:hypothetical protein